jgi:hypothetical protein
MNHSWDVLDSGDLRNVGRDMKATADCDSIAFILLLLAGLSGEVCDNMAGSIARDVRDPGVELNMRPELELGGIFSQVLAVADRGKEIGLIVASAEIRKASELLGRDELQKKLSDGSRSKTNGENNWESPRQ